MDPALRELIEHTPPGAEAEVILKLRDPSLPPPGVRVVCRFGDVVTGRVPADRLHETWSSDLVVSVKAPRGVRMEPRIDRPGDRPREVHALDPGPVRRPEIPEDGHGVVAAFLDWGCDFAHPNFRNPDGSTRLLALWHQGGDGAPGDADRYGYGAVHDRAAIDRALRSADPYGALGYHPAESDDAGDGAHGTHVMDICAGNGRAPRSLPGVAPAADLVFVDLDSDTVPGSAQMSLGDSVRMLEALDFVSRVAGERPWVANLSLGSMGGPHNGKTLVEQAMDNLLERTPSSAIVCSGGNYYGMCAHASGQLRPGERHTLGWRIAPEDDTPNELEVWYSGVERFSVELRGPAGEGPFFADPGDSARLVIGSREVGRMYHREAEPNSNDNHIDIFLDAVAPAGRWEVTLIGVDVMDGRYDAWIERDGSEAASQSHFDEEDAVRERTIGTICTGYRTVSVGAYDPHAPENPIAPFSSAGTSRDGRQKPELVAPGYDIVAARSAPRAPSPDQPLLSRKSGTSMAAPHVAGALALMFQAAPRPLKIWETRALLLGSVRPAPHLDPLRAGCGYLDVAEAVTRARHATRAPPLVPGRRAEAVREEVGEGRAEPATAEAPMDESRERGAAHGRESADAPTRGERERGDESHRAAAAGSAAPALRAVEALAEDRTPAAPGRLLGRVLAGSEAGPSEELGAAEVSPEELYAALAAEATGAGGRVRRVAAPGELAAGAARPGDLLLSRLPGEGRVSVSVLTEGAILPREEVEAGGARPTGPGRGGYAEVAEVGPFAKPPAERLALRIADAEGRLVAGRLLVRPEGAAGEAVRVWSVVGAAETRQAVRVDPARVRYLAFEGGGGKGFAFLGALQALEERGVVRYRPGGFGLRPPSTSEGIAGISGASAGAITALLVSCGYPSAEIQRVLLAEDFTRFYEDPQPGAVVRVRRGPHGSGGASLLQGVARALIGAATVSLPVSVAVRQLLLLLVSTTLEPPFSKLLHPDHVEGYLNCLRQNFGFFGGWDARRFFDRKLREALERISGTRSPRFTDATFATHREVTGIRLAVAGANLSTHKSEIFSAETTPGFPVADAVRISMGFPIAFKPVVISDPRAEGLLGGGADAMNADELRGVWVDGGLLDNLPMRAFDDPAATLGFRLEVDRANYRIDTLGVYLKELVGTLLSAGEAHVTHSRRTAGSTVMLDTDGLSLFDFRPEPTARERAVARAKVRVLALLAPPEVRTSEATVGDGWLPASADGSRATAEEAAAIPL